MTIVELEKPDVADDPVQELAKMSPLEYDRVRKDKAVEMGVRVSALDKQVAIARGEYAEETVDSIVEEISPWGDPVHGGDLLTALTETIKHHTVLPLGADAVLPVWALGSYCMDAWSIWPKLLITSPEKRCGKSVLMEVIEGLVYRGLLTSNISPSAIFRCIEEWAPSLLIDEADTFAKDNDELNGIINSGHRKRTAVVIRSEKEGDSFKPKKFSVWCPQAIAGIGNQRGTLHDRSIHIEMRRKLPGEILQKLPGDYYEQHKELRQRCLRWAEDHTGKLKYSRVSVPSCGNDRAEDNWQPIFAIAELVGGDWPERVLEAYRVMTKCHDDDDTIGPMILKDVREILEGKFGSVIHSCDLVDELIDLEERPWCEWKHGKPLTKNSLARLLKPYSVRSRQIRIGTINKFGYRKEDFQDAFNRYLPPKTPFQNTTTLQPSHSKGFSRFQNATHLTRVVFQKALKASQGAACSVVVFQKGETENKGVFSSYPQALIDAATDACSGLNISAGEFISRLDTSDYDEIISKPLVARATAQSMAATR